jgi:D-lactate dehydrogenase
MPKTTISFFELEKWEEKYIEEKLGKNYDLIFFKNPISKKNSGKIKNTEILAVFIYSNINNEIINNLPKLKYITTMSTGFDHIDLKAAKEKNIKVSNVPHYGENTVAEHTFALILALSRQIPESIDKIKKFDFSPSGLRGVDLKNKTLGIVGLGHIGEHVARIAQGFEMKVIAFDTKKNPLLAKNLKFKYVSFNELLENSDFISLHAPYNKHTRHMINKKNINKIKKGAYLINTSRGQLIDSQALLLALNKNILSGAGLDVLEEEGFIKEEKELLTKKFQEKYNLETALRGHIIIQHPKVIVTPHNAFNSKEALLRILDTTIENINGFIKKKPINLVKK